MYTFMKKEFKTEMEAVISWSKSSSTEKRFYTIFHNGKSSMKTYEIEGIEKLKKIVKGMNSIEVSFKNSDKIYMYRSIDKIDFNKIEYVTFKEVRGMSGNIVSWVRVYNINGNLIGIC